MRVTTCVFARAKPPVHLDKVAQRRPQPLRAGILHKSNPLVDHLAVLSVLGVSRQSLATFWTLLLISVSHQEARNFSLWPGGEREPLKNASSSLCRRDLLVGERQEAMKEAPMSGAWRQTRMRGA